jgi:cytoskeleton protein RodZ
MNAVLQPDVVNAVSPGAVLAAARAAQGLSVENVAVKLKLASFQIKAIEADNFSALPGAVFARGFVRNYARLLKIDAEPLLAAMAPKSVVSDERLLLGVKEIKGVTLEPARFRQWPMAATVAVCMVGALAYYEFALKEQPLSRAALKQPAVVALSPASAVAVELTPVISAQEGRDKDGDRDRDGQKPTEPVAGSRGLHFLFSKESWVEVRDGVDKVLFSQINPPGTEHRLNGEPPFKIVVGSMRGVQLSYNGSPIDLTAHATEDVARLKLE